MPHSAIERLVRILSPALAPAVDQAAAAARLAPLANPRSAVAQLAQLLAGRNGAYGFENALVLLPLGGDGPLELEAFNRDREWRDAYAGMADGLLVFAFDGFGGPFALDARGVVSFDPETGDTARLARDVEGWARALLADYDVLTGHPLVRLWQQRNRGLRPGERLAPVKPFTLGGAFAPDNLVAADLRASLRERARLARAIRDLPDGAQIRWPLP